MSVLYNANNWKKRFKQKREIVTFDYGIKPLPMERKKNIVLTMKLSIRN